MNYIEELKQYTPINEQEETDKALMLKMIEIFGDQVLLRDCAIGHMSASSMILNKDCTKVLMVYHNIYQSWSWTGGHADGETDMLALALREAKEETGILNLKILKDKLWAVDVLAVWSHTKRGKYVNSHTHWNYTYLFQADENEELHIKEDENSGVMWISINELEKYVREPEMIPVYRKLLREYI